MKTATRFYTNLSLNQFIGEFTHAAAWYGLNKDNDEFEALVSLGDDDYLELLVCPRGSNRFQHTSYIHGMMESVRECLVRSANLLLW